VGFGVLLFLAMTFAAVAVRAQTLTTLYNFCSRGSICLDGFYPYGGVAEGSDGNFYGTTSCGGSNPDSYNYCYGVGAGSFFKITPGGTLTTLYNFCAQPGCSDGFFPTVSPVQGSDGDIYGTTNNGGDARCSLYGCGTVFRMTPAGALTTLYKFGQGFDGIGPQSSLIQGKDGSFYGTTVQGGSNSSACGEPGPYGGCGTVFKIAPDGTLTTLYSLCSLANCTDGFEPKAPLVQGSDGNFYGTTSAGGANNAGTVFKITPTGALTTLYSFCGQSACKDGEMPLAGLAQGGDGSFYGTTYCGGTSAAYVAPCNGDGAGTIFKITPAGVLTTLYSFCAQPGCTDGEHPTAGLLRGSDGNFYGTTEEGGVNGGGAAGDTGGTIFQMTPAGTLTTLYSFCAQSNCTDGRYPVAPLVQGEDGNLYGISWQGGADGAGTVFRLSLVSGLADAFLSPPQLGFAGQAEGTTSTPLSVTVTSTGTADLVFPAGAVTVSGTGASSFAIASDGCSGQTLAPNGTCSVSVTFSPSAVGSETATLNFADNTPNRLQTASLAGSGVTPDFSLGVASGSPSSATVAPGGAASYSLVLAPVGGFDQPVSLTCTGAPSEAACSVDPPSVTLNGTSASTITVTVSTTASTEAGPPGFIHPTGPAGRVAWPVVFVLFILIVLARLGEARFGQRGRRRTACRAAWLRRAGLAAILLAMPAFVACGGSGSSGPPPISGTPAGTYTLTVTGTSGSLTHSTSLILTVN
jgi:uncharacterized repeat protein (TIGR03803 family)